MNEPKKYKITFPIPFNVDNYKNVFDLLTTKAILVEMLYKNKIIHR